MALQHRVPLASQSPNTTTIAALPTQYPLPPLAIAQTQVAASLLCQVNLELELTRMEVTVRIRIDFQGPARLHRLLETHLKPRIMWNAKTVKALWVERSSLLVRKKDLFII